MRRLAMREVAGSNPRIIMLKMPLVEKATGNHSVKLTSTEKLKALALCSARLYCEYASQFFMYIIDV